ncbi:MAG: magnesium transporter [Thiomicrorhabdus chilensis]|uniref:magnesium transporter n=1 Tax=Thiomicrorhabdus chilensis TaxID=63656 RepID=UPI000400379F|nr:magnesium transporter [Thiomicrorhabdus chilensis]MDX1347387.1 magnesium transporter [Thiomicrorhabdus chilensis]
MVQSNTVIDKAQVTEQLLAAVQDQNFSQIQPLLSQLVAEDIAELLESMPPKGRHFLWGEVGAEVQGEILAHTNDEVRASLLEQLEPHEITEITENLETDDIADIAQSLNDENQQTLLDSLNEENRTAVEMALSYPDDTAGGLMSTDFISVRADVTLDVVLRYLRKLGTLPTSTVDLFVRDREDFYVGTLKINDLLTHDPDTLVSELLDTNKPTIRAFTPEKEVAQVFEKHDLISIAVVSDHNQILGRITIDDVVDIIREEGEHAQMISAGLNEDEDIFAPATRAAKRRTFWLGINLLTAIFASIVIGLFDASIEKIVALAVLMPIIASMGGIAGTQTSTIVIRALATGKLGSQNSRSLLIKETSVGALNGIIWACLTGLAVMLWFQDLALSLIFASAMLINLLAAALAGASIPLMLQRMRIDPALASGLMLTTVTDSLGFFVFLGLATIVLL